MSDADLSEGTPSGTVDEAAIFSKEGHLLNSAELSNITPHNFRKSGFLSDADMRRLSILHQKFVIRLSARLSTFLRLECVLNMTKFNSTTFQNFLDTTAQRTHISLFQVEPLRGVCLLELGLNGALSVSDRLLGGKGRVADQERQLTEIELTLLEDVSQLVLSEWTQIWHDDEWVMTPILIGHETSGRFIQTSAPSSVFVVMTALFNFGDITDELRLGIPFSMVEQMVKRMHLTRQGGEETKARKKSWRVPYTAIPVELTAEWPVKEIELREAMAIKVGDVIDLPRTVVNETVLNIGGSPEFVGTVGVQDGKISLQIADRMPKLQ